MSITIPIAYPNLRRRALEAQASVGSHAWDIGNWDAEADAEAYCLDAVQYIPAGSTLGFVGLTPIGTWVSR